ncbi:MAG: LysM peptidoglycan-binding domain-containing protein [Candidatus Promineifilaceae bacterium]
MKFEGQAPPELRTNLLLVTSVILTVLVALFLAASDNLQSRLPTPVQPTAVVVQSGVTATPTLPSPSPSPLPVSTPSVTPAPSLTSETPTVTEVKPTSSPTATPNSIIAEVSCNYAPPGWQPVLVQPNDTLYGLSIVYGATVGEIVQANCLASTTIFSGTILYLPATPPTRTPCGPPQDWDTYIVQSGDTLFSLALQYGTTVYAIMQANCLTDSRIYYGRRLYLPKLSIPPTAAPTATALPPTNTPMPNPTAVPTHVPSPVPSATPSRTPVPTATATTVPPSATATWTSTPPPASPTATPTTPPPPTSTPVPTNTPTNTPQPTATAVPTNTPTVPPPTSTPVPTNTPTNTPQPTATDTPIPPSER